VRVFENSGRCGPDFGKAEKNGGWALNDLSGNFAVKISLFSEVKIDGRLENDIDHRNAHKWYFCARRSVITEKGG
jgi:hypothetical protein